MEALKTLLITLHEDESGITTLEFLLITIFVAVMSLTAVELLGDNIIDLYEDIHESMSSEQIRGGLSA